MIEKLEAEELTPDIWHRTFVCERDHRHGGGLHSSRAAALRIDGRYEDGVYVGPYPRLACSGCRGR